MTDPKDRALAEHEPVIVRDDHGRSEGRALLRLLDAADHPFGYFVIDSYGENQIRAIAWRGGGRKREGVGMTLSDAVAAALDAPTAQEERA